jgi:hypothetical protein
MSSPTCRHPTRTDGLSMRAVCKSEPETGSQIRRASVKTIGRQAALPGMYLASAGFIFLTGFGFKCPAPVFKFSKFTVVIKIRTCQKMFKAEIITISAINALKVSILKIRHQMAGHNRRHIRFFPFIAFTSLSFDVTPGVPLHMHF